MIIVDSHVHFYACFDRSHFLESAYRNFQVTAERFGQGDFNGVLLFAEGESHDWFARWRQETEHPDLGQAPPVPGAWKFQATLEDISLRAEGPSGESIFIICGRQVVTAENIEILALFTDCGFPGGISFSEVVQEIQESGGIAVIPWGVGKWLGRRGRFLRSFLEKHEGKAVFLGDNGGRPGWWPDPVHFKVAKQKNIPVLHGSDPLPLVAESRRPGSFGFFIRDMLSGETPARDLKEIIVSQVNEVENYGRLEYAHRFLLNQLMLRLR